MSQPILSIAMGYYSDGKIPKAFSTSNTITSIYRMHAFNIILIT